MTDPTPLGRLLADDPPTLEYVRRLRHPVEKVWRAITEREHLRAWFPVDLVGERREGARLELPFWPEVLEQQGFEDPGLGGEIRTWDPPRVFEWTWDTDLVRFELEPDGEGTVLTLTTWLRGGDATTGQAAAGYHVCLDHLGRLLDTGSAPPVTETDPSTLEARYGEALGEIAARPIAG